MFRTWPKILLGCMLLGCTPESTGPPPLTQQDRDATKQRLTAVGAKVTADVPEGLYLSLRNTHVELRELGGSIEGSYATRPDLRDFAGVSTTVAAHFLEESEVPQFRDWLRETFADPRHSVTQSEYHEFKATLSRTPLRLIFTRRAPPEAE